MSSIQLSVSLQTYNRGSSGYLRAALEAILAQTYGDFELLVIDNHSTDETPEIVLSCKDPRLTYMRLPPGGTPADSIRRAFGASRGRYLLTTHDDDIMEPTMIARQMRIMEEHPELGCLATNVSLIDERGDILQQKLYEMKTDRFFGIGDYIQTYFEEKLWFPTPTLLFNRDISSSRNSSFACEASPTYAPSGDIAGMFNMNMHAQVAILAEPLLRYRQHAAQESRNVDQSAPLVALAKYAESLLAAPDSDQRLRALAPTVHAFSARYQAQDHLFKSAGAPLDSALMKLKTHWEHAVKPDNRSVDAALPFEILLGETGKGLSIPDDALDRLMRAPATGGSQLAYRQWASLLHSGSSLFAGARGLKRIAILGSMLTAYLLVLAAKRCGIEVVYCLDSSPARIGKDVFGIPVVSHEYLLDLGGLLDAVILSSERDHDEGLRKILSPAQERRSFQIYSWKELAAAGFRQDASLPSGNTIPMQP
ncbi:MAG: glycosyltransferase family 2 protein [Gammaproteobacteria bacterium]|nr:glycosyltransferase family 2 protein [Sideroxydans sp.]MBU3904446.1 glycosyltransferase family 2 protein [Gammaproteobacteria bacterium]MBU4046429.1 glycosyltransferase family 2 protein [Gammaproteobacteria bacterium]MBU4150850.1 glycosyltransferase family 2 protein [Gammaproteobacteria bacterium]